MSDYISNKKLPITAPTLQYKSEYLDSYYDPDRQHKSMKPRIDLVLRGLFRPHADEEIDTDNLPVVR